MYIPDFTAIGTSDVAAAGGKGADFGELMNAGFPVPDGFIISPNAYREFVKDNNIDSTSSPQKSEKLRRPHKARLTALT